MVSLLILYFYRIRQLQEAGIIRKWIDNIIERHQAEEEDEVRDPDDGMHILRVDDVQGAFSVLCIGLLSACMSCVVEKQIVIMR